MKTKVNNKTTQIWNSDQMTEKSSLIFFGSEKIKNNFDIEEIERSLRIALSTKQNRGHEILKIYLFQKSPNQTEMVIRPIDPHKNCPVLPIHCDTIYMSEKRSGSIILIKDSHSYRAITINEYLTLIGIDPSKLKEPIRHIINFRSNFSTPKLYTLAKSRMSKPINKTISVC